MALRLAPSLFQKIPPPIGLAPVPTAATTMSDTTPLDFHYSEQIFDEQARSLISMCAERDIVLLKDIAQRLGLSVGEELEDTIMKVILANAIKAKIDERAGNLHVYWYFQLAFGDEQWKLLSRSIDVLLGRLAKSSEYVQDCIKQRHQPWQKSDAYNDMDNEAIEGEDLNEEDEDAEEVSQD
ncbi:hypothetical protein QR680_002403 [Steinernema hermaphroditum]|uniref:PCI domain-containing protein n=1 Tax=Steinernema hermaphroditum TaxID=289476 RepID=A0AA39H3H3_9BILA|nr:hypothetical protein QR680_002403 [Steinernema hermaphroditum]